MLRNFIPRQKIQLSHVLKPRFRYLYADKPSAIKSFGLRIKTHLEPAAIDLSLISQKSLPNYPPWLFLTAKVHFETPFFKKADKDDRTYQSPYLKIRNQYPSYMP